jgi:hypothetical protein
MDDHDKIVAMLAVLAESYGRTLTPAALDMMADALSDLSYDEARAAVRAHQRGPRAAFFPQPGELLTALRGDPDAAAALALSRTQERRYGDDPIANRCILALGGEYACRHMEPGVWAGQFRRLYSALHAAGLGPVLAETRGFLGPGETVPMIETQAVALLGETVRFTEVTQQ